MTDASRYRPQEPGQPDPTQARREPSDGAVVLCSALALLLFGGLWLTHARLAGAPAATLVAFAPGWASQGAGAFLSLGETLASAYVALFLPGLVLMAVVRRLPLPTAFRDEFTFDSVHQRVVTAFLLSVFLWCGAILLWGGLDVARLLRSHTTLSAAVGMGAVGMLWALSRPDRLQTVVGAMRSLPFWLLMAVALALVAHHDYLSFNTLTDDEIEAFEFATSLTTRGVPFWNIENGTWGFYPTFMLFAYPAHVLMGVLGSSEFAVRALYFVSLLVAVSGAAAMLERLRGRSLTRPEALLLVGAAGVVTTVALFYNSWHPYVSGLAEPSGVDMLGFALFTGTVTSFFQRRVGWFLAFALAHYAALPNGGAYTAVWLALAFVLRPGERRWVVRVAVLYVAIVAGYQGVCQLLLPEAAPDARLQFGVASMMDRYLADVSTAGEWLEFGRNLLVLSGGAVVLAGLVVRDLPNRDTALSAAFLLVHTVVSGFAARLHHPHYQLPMMFFVCVLALAGVARLRPTARRIVLVALGTAYLGTMIGLTPRDAPMIDNARRLAADTRLDCGLRDVRALYQEATGLAISYEHPGLVTWRVHGLDIYVWIRYVLRAPPNPAPRVIIAEASSPVPAGFRRVGAGRVCQVVVSDAFNPDDYQPDRGYRDEAAWSALATRRWRERF